MGPRRQGSWGPRSRGRRRGEPACRFRWRRPRAPGQPVSARLAGRGARSARGRQHHREAQSGRHVKWHWPATWYLRQRGYRWGGGAGAQGTPQTALQEAHQLRPTSLDRRQVRSWWVSFNFFYAPLFLFFIFHGWSMQYILHNRLCPGCWDNPILYSLYVLLRGAVNFAVRKLQMICDEYCIISKFDKKDLSLGEIQRAQCTHVILYSQYSSYTVWKIHLHDLLSL